MAKSKSSKHRATITVKSSDKIKVPSSPLSDEWLQLPHYAPPKGNIERSPLSTTMPPLRRGEGPTTECLLQQGMKAKILAIPGFPQPCITPEPPRYEIKPILGKGLGMVAAVDIDVGELIVMERPLTLSVESFRFPPGWLSDNLSYFPELMIERLWAEDYEEFFALDNCKGNTRPHYQGILDTNAIAAGAMPSYDKVQAGAVCKVISRVNHSCSPNAIWKFDLRSFAMHLRAIMPIKKGEEVTITYGDMLESRDQRREFLLKSSKFNCDCSACASWTPESDQHRMMIKAIRRNIKPSSFDDSKLLAWVEDPTKPDDLIVAECHSVLSLYDAEQCYPDRTWNIWYQRLVKAYCALEEEEEARKWAEKAAKLSRAHVHHDAGWDAVARDPKKTDWWGRRARFRSGKNMTKIANDMQVLPGVTDASRSGPPDEGYVISLLSR